MPLEDQGYGSIYQISNNAIKNREQKLDFKDDLITEVNIIIEKIQKWVE